MLDKSMMSQFDAISQYTTYKENNAAEKTEHLRHLAKFKKKNNARKVAKHNLQSLLIQTDLKEDKNINNNNVRLQTTKGRPPEIGGTFNSNQTSE